MTDLLIAVALIACPLIIALILFRGYAPAPLIVAHIKRERAITAAFASLVAVAISLGAAITAQERGLRVGSAAAADGFDIIVTPPGSDVTAMLASVFLQPSNLGLLDGSVFAELYDNPRVKLAAPLAFGDSHDGRVIVGTTADFVAHLASTPVTGRLWQTTTEALVGADTALLIGTTFFPDHGHGFSAQQDVHGTEITVVGTLPRTGTPWDGAILVPVESVWETHGLTTGHAATFDLGNRQGETTQPQIQPEALHGATHLGPPFDPDLFPGTPAIIVIPESPASAYGLRLEFDQRSDTMAFFPAQTLAGLYGVMGDIRGVMSVLAMTTQLLVAGAVLLALTLLARLHRKRTAMLRAIGAPARFVMAVAWGHAALILAFGTTAGLALALGASTIISGIVADRTGMTIPASLGWPELHLALAFFALASIAALFPAWRATKSAITPNLRA